METAERAERRKIFWNMLFQSLLLRWKSNESSGRRCLDQGNRLILNFGHTIGHAIENTAGYGVVSHGEGVAIGMVAITSHAEKIGLFQLDRQLL